ncbi:uncharacterized protein KQ657_001471 [Scheffersomyces spartinae]|uniref:ABC1 atypical kinase-like domain-containing protein n=1 Tax=Scheffersomyces spartinae TaxID=45513 RepID=A0A9P7V7K3_9ASCO|nr:uncharacterized protein KQ657_001471 [Scheffersomyces spartinae]KAG7192690.1 hypothetical protein KQ657_001471 [Scheffersomyces spartinae]
MRVGTLTLLKAARPLGRMAKPRSKPGSGANTNSARPPSTSSRSNTDRRSGPWRKLTTVSIIGIIGGTTVYYTDESLFLSVFGRTIRATYVLSWVAYQYSKQLPPGSKELADLHEEAAEKLYQMLMTNKGLYIKIGQAIANQGSVFPIAYQKRFVKLYDNAPNDSWRSIDKVLKANLGNGYQDKYFESIDTVPVASASVAQVHRGYLKDVWGGQPVAIKVQHPYIPKQTKIDLLVYRVFSVVFERVFDIPMSFYTSYISDELQCELNFINEMVNAERLQAAIANDPGMKNEHIVIPKVYHEFTTLQTLITEWMDGVPLLDKAKILEKKFDVGRMVSQYIQVFARQIFKYGFVHLDPHPGNIMVRFNEQLGDQELIILDHGLYTTLPPRFQDEYRELWRHLYLFNKKGVVSISRNWGINEAELFATIMLLRPANFMSKSEKDALDTQLRETSVQDLLRGFISDKGKFPLELLFVVRAMRMIQNLNQHFGSPVNRINVFSREAIGTSTPNGISDWMKLLFQKLTLFSADLVFGLIRFRQWVWGDKYGSKAMGLEDYFEEFIKDSASKLGLEWFDLNSPEII